MEEGGGVVMCVLTAICLGTGQANVLPRIWGAAQEGRVVAVEGKDGLEVAVAVRIQTMGTLEGLLQRLEEEQE